MKKLLHLSSITEINPSGFPQLVESIIQYVDTFISIHTLLSSSLIINEIVFVKCTLKELH